MAFGKAKPPVDIAWRPDFRMPERLPDIKPVRTDFFINFAGISFALFALVLFSFQEYTIFNANSEINIKKADLNNTVSKQEEYTKNNTAFVKAEVNLAQFLLFYSKQISVSDLLVLLCRETPKGITLESIRQVPQIRTNAIATAIEISGYVRDPDTTRANDSLNAFLEILFKSPELKGKNVSHVINPQDFAKDAERGVVKFKVRIEITPVAPAGTKPVAK